jgi:hypothetical protein
MDIESRLRALELRYGQLLSAAAAAKGHYLALLDEPGSIKSTVKRARHRWENLDARKRAIAARMGEIEGVERDLMI